MDDVKEREIGNSSEATTTILIATQGSKFKKEITENITAHFQNLQTFIEIIDVKSLDSFYESDWDAIFINHTWEMHKAPESVESFVNNLKNKKKLVVFGTSQDGTLSLKNVDAISGASIMKQVPQKSQEIIDRLHLILPALN